MINMSSKECRQCSVIYPITKEFWHRDNSSTDGFRHTCKMCRAEDLEDKRKEEIDSRLKKLEEGGFDLLDKLVQGGSNVPHMAETFQRIMEAFGGPGGFAQQLIATYYRATPGSQQRQRILDSIMRLNNKVSESGAAQKSLEELSNEELDQEIEKSIQQYADPDITTLYKLSPAHGEEETESS